MSLKVFCIPRKEEAKLFTFNLKYYEQRANIKQERSGDA